MGVFCEYLSPYVTDLCADISVPRMTMTLSSKRKNSLQISD